MPDDVNRGWLESDGMRLHLVQRPLVGLVVFARRGENRQLGQGASERG